MKRKAKAETVKGEPCKKCGHDDYYIEPYTCMNCKLAYGRMYQAKLSAKKSRDRKIKDEFEPVAHDVPAVWIPRPGRFSQNRWSGL